MKEAKHARHLPLILALSISGYQRARSFSVWSNEWTTAKRNTVFRARSPAPSIPILSTGTASFPIVGRELENVIPADDYEEEAGCGRRSAVVDDFFASDATASRRLYRDIRSRAALLRPSVVANRRLLHRHPELMYQEAQTASIIRKALTDMGVAYTNGLCRNGNPDRIPGPGGHGIIADIGTGGPPCVLLRADMDALPIRESAENCRDEYRSRNDGRMHACGHDGHVAMLLGAAAVLKDMEDSIQGTVRLMFQPAEEGGAGAKTMREEGVLERSPRVDCAFGLHLWPTLASGVIASRPGPLLSASDRFKVEFTGKGGHAAMPHLAIDPIVATSATVMNLQTIVSRGLSPLESGVVSVTKVEAGDSFNVIPGTSTMCGTVRALSAETLESLRDRVDRIARQTAETHGCEADIQHSPQHYPPTVNDPNLFEFSSSVVGPLCQSGELKEVDPVLCGEDFAFIAEAVPSNFFFLGQGSGTNPRTDFGLHHEQFAIDENVLPLGVELHVNLALRALKELA